MKKLVIYLISLFLLFVISCEGNHHYSINWVLFEDFEEYTEAVIKFQKIDSPSLKKYEYILKPNSTKKIKVPNNTEHFGEEITGNARMLLYPDPDRIPNGGPLEIYLYRPSITRISENAFEIEKKEGVKAYFLEFEREGKRYEAYSKDNIVSLNNEITAQHYMQSLKDIEIDDLYYYDEFSTNNSHGSTDIWGGYIVESKIDGTLLWLNSRYPMWKYTKVELAYEE